MLIPFQDVLQSVNKRLDAREVLRLLAFRPDGISAVGMKLKCFCPVHRGETFKSLQIDTQTNECQCIVRECAAYESGTLVHLYAKAKGIPAIAGAMELIRIYSLAIDPGAMEDVAHHYLVEARAGVESGNRELALKSLVTAASANPQNPEIAALRAEVEEESLPPHEAIELWLDAARLWAIQSPQPAERIIAEECLRLDPQHRESLLRLAELQRQNHPDDSIWADTFLQRAQLNLLNYALTDALQDVDRALERLGESAEAHRVRADILQALGRTEDLQAELKQVAALYESEGATEQALAMVVKLSELDPDDEALREKIAALRLRMGDSASFAVEIEIMGKAALKRGEAERAAELFGSLLDKDSESMVAIEGLAEAAGLQGDSETQARHLTGLADAYSHSRDVRKRTAVLLRLHELCLSGAKELRAVADGLREVGVEQQAADSYLRAGDALLGEGNVEEASACFLSAMEINARPESALHSASEAFLRHGHGEQAAAGFAELAAMIAARGERQEALDLLDSAVERCGTTSELENALIEMLLHDGDAPRLFPLLGVRHERLLREEKFTELEELLRRVMEQFPDEPDSLEWLADLYLLTGREEEAGALLDKLAREEKAPLQLRIRAAESLSQAAPEDGEPLLLLGELQELDKEQEKAANAYQQAAQAFLQASPERSLSALERAIVLQPEEAAWQEQAAAIAIALGRGETASRLYRDLIALRKRSGDPEKIRETYSSAIDALAGEGALAEEYAAWLREAGLKSDAVLVLLEAAHSASRDGHSDEALRLADEALNIDGANLAASWIRVESSSEKAAIEAARKHLVSARASNDSAEIRRALEFLLKHSPESIQELEQLRQVTAISEGVVAARPHLSRLLDLYSASTQAPDKFRAMTDELLATDPANHEAIEHRASLLHQRGSDGEALKDLRQLVSVHRNAQRTDDAMRILTTAAEWAPNNREIIADLAAGHELHGDSEKAAETWMQLAVLDEETGDGAVRLRSLQQVSRLLPEDAGAARHVADQARKLGLLPEAEAALEHLVGLCERAGKQAEAAEALETLLIVTDGSPAILQRVSDAYRHSGNEEKAIAARLRHIDAMASAHDDAISSAERGLEHFPDSLEIRSRLAELYFNNDRAEDYTRELKYIVGLQLAVVSSAAAIQTLGEGASRLLAMESYEGACELLSVYTELAGDAPELLVLAARAELKAGRNASAAANLRRLAALHLKNNDAAEAESALKRAIDIDPEDFRAREMYIATLMKQENTRWADINAELHAVADIYTAAHDLNAATSAYQRIVDHDPEDMGALHALAALYIDAEDRETAAKLFHRVGELHFQSDDFTSARESFEEVLRLDPDQPMAHRSLMRVFKLLGETQPFLEHARSLAELYDRNHALEDANLVYEAICQHDPDDEASHERLAEYYQQTAESAKAAMHLREIYRIYTNADSMSKAMDVLHRIQRIDPDNPDTLEMMGKFYARLQDVEQAVKYLIAAAEAHEAIKNYKHAAELTGEIIILAPHDEGTRALRVSLFEKLGDHVAAAGELKALAETAANGDDSEKEIAFLRRVLAHTPEDQEIRERYALLLSDLDQSEEAAGEFLHLSVTRRDLGDLPGAIDAATTGCTLAPDNPQHRRHLADLYTAQGDNSRAASAILRLVEYYQNAGDLQRALRELETAPSLHKDPELLLRAGHLNAAMGKSTEARKAFAAVLDGADRRPSLTRDALRGIFELNPLDEEALSRLSTILLEGGESEEVAQLYLKTAGAQLEIGDVDRAREVLEEGIRKTGEKLLLRRGAADLFALHSIPELAAQETSALAEEFRSAGEFDKALEEIDRASRIGPLSIESLELKLLILQKLDRVDEGYAAAEQLLDALLRRNSGEKAIKLCREMIALRPKEPKPRTKLLELLGATNESSRQIPELRALADLYLQREEMDKAAETLRTLLDLRPDDTRARIHYIDAYRQIGNEVDLADDYLKLAEIYTRHGAILEATRTYEKLLTLAPERIQAHEKFIEFLFGNSQTTRAVAQGFVLSELCAKSGDAQKTVEVLQRLTTNAGQDPQIRLTLGRAYAQQGARGMAARELRQAAILFAASEAHDLSVETYRELLIVDPLNLETRQLLIEGLTKTGRRDEAVAAIEELSERYMERGLADIAEVELRRAIGLDANRPSTWLLLFKAAEALNRQSSVVDGYVEYADLMARNGDVKEAVEYYLKAMSEDYRHIRARQGYVTQYPKIGALRDIVDDVLHLAQLLIEAGQVDEAAKYFELVMSIDPQNTVARDMLSATQARNQSSTANPRQGTATCERRSAADFILPHLEDESPLSESQRRFIQEKVSSASDFLEGTLNQLEQEENQETLAQVVTNYRDILAVNSQNSSVRVKLADVLEQMGRFPEMLNELALASETQFSKGELAQCAHVCERYLVHAPNDQRIRKRLNEAVVKRDAFRALESAILFSDRDDEP
ncbi:hypothetical protein BH09SUM1_BH09SUM1_04090 [soil metagenome]